MIIKSISMKNFQCYYGSHEENKIEFSDGINIIIGDNGGGKSKLFDSFYWTLYDQIFNSDERIFTPSSVYKERLISDKAKKECEIGQTVSTETELIVADSQGTEYKVSRIFRAKKTDDREWQAEPSKLLIDKLKNIRWEVVPKEKHQSILERIIPGHLKPYMWFQGEQVDSLMDFKNKSSLMQAINLLSDISEFDDLIKITDNGKKKAEISYNKQAKLLSKNESESKKLAANLDKINQKIDSEKKQHEELEKEYNTAKLHIEELINKIDDAQRKSTLKAEAENLQLNIDGTQDRLDKNLKGFNKKLFSKSWVLKEIQPTFDSFSSKYAKYYKEHIEITNSVREQKVQLPINIPQPIHINEMISDELCFVCNRQALKGSVEHEHIKSLLNRKPAETKELFLNDCSNFFERLYNNSLGFKQTIRHIDESIANEISEISSLKSDIQNYDSALKEINEQFEGLLSEDKSDNIVNSFKTHQSKADRLSQRISDINRSLESDKSERDSLKAKLDNLIVGEVDKNICLSNDIFDSLNQIAIATRDDVFSSLVNELEVAANNIFQSMTAINRSITGRLKLKMLSKNSCVPEIVDSEGFLMSGSNDSNIILVKLSLIMAIITSRARWSKNYCLVSDAPTSKMSKKYSNGFYNALGENYKQSIVMTYDFLSEDDHDLFSEYNIGKVYKLNSHYPNGNREDRSDLSIKISEVQ